MASGMSNRSKITIFIYIFENCHGNVTASHPRDELRTAASELLIELPTQIIAVVQIALVIMIQLGQGSPIHCPRCAGSQRFQRTRDPGTEPQCLVTVTAPRDSGRR